MSRTPAVHAEKSAQLRSTKASSCVTLIALIFLQVFRLCFCEPRSHKPLSVSPRSWHYKGSGESCAPQEGLQGAQLQLHPPMDWDQQHPGGDWSESRKVMGEKKMLCWYQQLQDVVQRSNGFCECLSCQKGTRESLVPPQPQFGLGRSRATSIA